MWQLYARAACSVCLALANFSCLFSPCTMKKSQTKGLPFVRDSAHNPLLTEFQINKQIMFP